MQAPFPNSIWITTILLNMHITYELTKLNTLKYKIVYVIRFTNTCHLKIVQIYLLKFWLSALNIPSCNNNY